MICNVCGRTIENEDANFCEYCGSSFREMKQSGSQNAAYQTVKAAESTVQESTMYHQNKPEWQGQSVQQPQWKNPVQTGQKDEPVSFLNWLGTMLLPFIPFFGPITYVVMLFVCAFGKDSNQNKKNWAKAKLIVLAISIAASIILLTHVMNTILSSGMTLEDFVNTTYK